MHCHILVERELLQLGDGAMPIAGDGWEFHIVRKSVQTRPDGARKRTVGTYRIFHDGIEQAGKLLRGMIAECKGPGANRPAGNGKRVEAGRYPVATHLGARYRTIGFDPDSAPGGHRRPSLLLLNTGERAGILIHPGRNFLSSIGCFNPCTSLPDGAEMMDFEGSLARTIAIIADLRSFLGSRFPAAAPKRVPGAAFVIDGEP
jgi:hypothetical protein